MRDLFHVPERYFLSHSVGCQLKSAATALESAYLAPWQTEGGGAWDGWMAALSAFQTGLASLIGAQADLICPQTNVSSALTKILYAMSDSLSGRTLLCTREDFPSMGYVLQQAERAGFQVKFVEGDPTQVASWERCLDATIGLVFITHVFSNTSRMTPVAEICAMARQVEAISIVDIAQSAGIAAVDVTAWQVDFAIGTGVKFLCAGPGACFLYVRAPLVEQAQPLDVGWFSHADPFEMDIQSFRFAESAMRFFGGTPSPAPLILANEAFRLWQQTGLESVQNQVTAYLSHLVAAVPTELRVSPSDPDKRGATLVLDPPNRDHFAHLLQAQGFKFDQRQAGFRFSVHAYTPQQDVEALADALGQAL